MLLRIGTLSDQRFGLRSRPIVDCHVVPRLHEVAAMPAPHLPEWRRCGGNRRRGCGPQCGEHLPLMRRIVAAAAEQGYGAILIAVGEPIGVGEIMHGDQGIGCSRGITGVALENCFPPHGVPYPKFLAGSPPWRVFGGHALRARITEKPLLPAAKITNPRYQMVGAWMRHVCGPFGAQRLVFLAWSNRLYA